MKQQDSTKSTSNPSPLNNEHQPNMEEIRNNLILLSQTTDRANGIELAGARRSFSVNADGALNGANGQSPVKPSLGEYREKLKSEFEQKDLRQPSYLGDNGA